MELSPIRKAIADRVVASHTEIPVFHIHAEVDGGPILELRSRLKDEWEEAPSVNDIILKCCAAVLPDHDVVNAGFVDGKVRLYKEVNVGFAVATDKGVLVPVVKGANEKSLADVAEETRDMIAQARKGRLRASLQQGGTFSISNIGPGRVTAFNAIIGPPQTAILAIGALAKRPFVVDGELAVRSTMWLTLTVDHRAIDGADGAEFLEALVAQFEDPAPACDMG
jgi:pyruvate dehydrogenase E2 component (dihydrolipoamide acetyltransferase)